MADNSGFTSVKKLTPGVPEEVHQVMQQKQRLETIVTDEQKVRNRIQLLLHEEEKINKKINETKTRAIRIHEAKQRNEERYVNELRRKQEAELKIAQQ